MFDDLRAAKQATFQWLLHAYQEIQVDEASRSLRITNSPAAMNVRLLLPREVSFSQTDKYEPEPESTVGSWKNTWHLSASTVDAARSARFLSVFLPFREGTEDKLPEVERLEGEGAVGVRLAWPDGVADVVGFRTNPEAKIVRCGGMTGDGAVFAHGTDSQGRPLRSIEQPQE